MSSDESNPNIENPRINNVDININMEQNNNTKKSPSSIANTSPIPRVGCIESFSSAISISSEENDEIYEYDARSINGSCHDIVYGNGVDNVPSTSSRSSSISLNVSKVHRSPAPSPPPSPTSGHMVHMNNNNVNRNMDQHVKSRTGESISPYIALHKLHTNNLSNKQFSTSPRYLEYKYNESHSSQQRRDMKSTTELMDNSVQHSKQNTNSDNSNKSHRGSVFSSAVHTFVGYLSYLGNSSEDEFTDDYSTDDEDDIKEGGSSINDVNHSTSDTTDDDTGINTNNRQNNLTTIDKNHDHPDHIHHKATDGDHLHSTMQSQEFVNGAHTMDGHRHDKKQSNGRNNHYKKNEQKANEHIMDAMNAVLSSTTEMGSFYVSAEMLPPNSMLERLMDKSPHISTSTIAPSVYNIVEAVLIESFASIKDIIEYYHQDPKINILWRSTDKMTAIIEAAQGLLALSECFQEIPDCGGNSIGATINDDDAPVANTDRHKFDLCKLLTPHRVLNTLQSVPAPSILKPFDRVLQSLLSTPRKAVAAAILNHPSNCRIITCPSRQEPQRSSTTPVRNNPRDNNNRNKKNRKNRQHQNDNNNQEQQNNCGGDGGDEKNNGATNDQRYDNLTRSQLIQIIKRQQKTIQQQRTAIDTLQHSHQALIQNFGHSSPSSQPIQTTPHSPCFQRKKQIDSPKFPQQPLIHPLNHNIPNSPLPSFSLQTIQQMPQESQRLKSMVKSPIHPQQPSPKQKPVTISSKSPKNSKKNGKATASKSKDCKTYYCEPAVKNRAYRNISIPHDLKSKIRESITDSFDKVICNANHKHSDECKCDGLFSWMDIDIGMQFNNEKHKSTKIFNHGFRSIKDEGDELFCVVEPAKGCISNSRPRLPWQMRNVFYTAEMIMEEFRLNKEQLPSPVRASIKFTTQQLQKVKITAFIQDAGNLKNLIKETKWCKILIFSKLNNKQRTTLFITKPEFQNVLPAGNNFDESEIDLIPILLFQKDGWQIHYLIVVIIYGSNIGISMIWDEKCETAKVTAMFVDKEMICRQHQWISLEHVGCGCLDKFKTSVNHLQIGNVDYHENLVKDLKGQNDKLKQENMNLKDELRKIQQSFEDGHNPRSPSISFKYKIGFDAASQISLN